MPTSRTPSSRPGHRPGAPPRGRADGVTLFELMLVIALLAMTMLLAIPSFQGLMQSALDKEMNRLTGVLRTVRNEAIMTRRNFRLMFNMELGVYEVQQKGFAGGYTRLEFPKMLAPHQFPQNFKITDMEVYGTRYEPPREEPVPIGVNTSGMIDPFLIHFTESGTPWTLKVTGFVARMTLEKGETEFKEEDFPDRDR